MAAKTPKVWLVWRGKTQEPQWKQLPVTDDRLDWHWPHTPKGAVRFILSRRGKTPKWIYASFGATREIAANNVNKYDLESVEKMRQRIAEAEARMVKP